MKPICGTIVYKNRLIPATAEVRITPLGRECYATGFDNKGNCTIRYLDDNTFKELNYKLFLKKSFLF